MRINECDCGCGGTSAECMAGGQSEKENYMFFGNLETMKRAIDAMLQMDPNEVDSILQDGHNWAADHIATSKDDVEEVAGFLMNRMDSGRSRMDGVPMMGNKQHFIHTFESYMGFEKRETEHSDESLAEKLLRAVRTEDWDLVKEVSMALRYRRNY